MKTLLSRRKTQRGAALILFLSVLVVGVAWYAVGALGKAAPTAAEREIKTGLALQAARQALLAYVAQYAARPDTAEPGQLPCPELLSSIGTSSAGQAAASCSNAAAVVGRLPWRTLGIDQLRDGGGEPLWYVISPSFRSAPINYATVGQLTFNGAANAAVAVIIAPGRPVNTLSDPGTPPAGCSKVNQEVSTRNTASLVAANFLECGNATGSYANLGTSQWSNDRVIAITTQDWLNAIEPPVVDRLQRQVAALLADWDQVELAATGRSWGATHGVPYLPFADNWGNPTTNDYCGNQGSYEGAPPIDPSCFNNPWTGNSSASGGMVTLGGCTDMGTYLRCRFQRAAGTTPLSVQITATAIDVAQAFRSTIAASDLTITGGGTAAISMAISASNSNATATINVTWPLTLLVGANVEVQIPHLQNAAVLSDARYLWFWNNNWHQYAYYAVARGATASPASPCSAPGDPDCLIVSGLPAWSGNPSDKRLVLVLSGRPLAGQSQPSSSRTDYFEADNATTGDRSFVSGPLTASFNDRVAACPFQYPADPPAAAQIVCN